MHFLKNEPQNFSKILEMGKYSSPNGNYELVMQLCVSSSSSWLRGTLTKDGNFSRMIYWNKVEGDARVTEEIDVEWTDSDVVKIEDIEFIVSDFPNVEVYDYSSV